VACNVPVVDAGTSAPVDPPANDSSTKSTGMCSDAVPVSGGVPGMGWAFILFAGLFLRRERATGRGAGALVLVAGMAGASMVHAQGASPSVVETSAAATPTEREPQHQVSPATPALVRPLAIAGAVLLPAGLLVALVGVGVGGLGIAGTAITPRWPNGAARPFPGEPVNLAQSRILGAFGLLVASAPVMLVAAAAVTSGTALLVSAAVLKFYHPAETEAVRVAVAEPAPAPAPQEQEAPPAVVETPVAPPPAVVAVVEAPKVPEPDPDADGDGVADGADLCPGEAGPSDNRGCPWGDRDHDGLADNIDRCPTEAGPADSGGCPAAGVVASKPPPALDPRCMVPENLAVVIKDDQVLIPTKIQFAPGTATILKGSENLLSQIALTLKCRSDISKLRVDGYTDSSGGADLNTRLSRNRADAVKDHLVKKGKVAATRLVAEGHGPSDPIASNENEAGREKNRRVEFTIVEMSR
jgi:outer membrane protein OmpA-like peptidoglycan-associated protein